MNKKQKPMKYIRTAVQSLVLFIVFMFGLNHFLGEKGFSFLPSYSTHSICPFGGVETTYTLLTEGVFVSKIHSSAFILFVIGMVVVLLFGAIFCGFICPFGTVSEWVGKIGKKLFPKRFNRFVPAKIDKPLRFLRYVVLTKILYETAVVGKLTFEAQDPYYAMMNFFSGEVLPTAFVVLGIALVASLFVERAFCKYACPYGAVLGLFGRFSIFKPKRNKSTCTNCKLCDKICPMNIEVSTQNNVVGHHCISCYKCVSGEGCPVENTLTISTVWEKEGSEISYER